MSKLKNKTILITGGTGSFGNKFVPMTLDAHDPKKIIIYSRDEMKQWDMAMKFKDDLRVVFVVGDVRDKERLSRVMTGIDHVVHAAATKIVPTAEYNPFECIKTNINGAMNVIDSAIDAKVKKVVALSTDKASSPINLYGATKLASDKLFVAANSYSGKQLTSFSVVRYGNVMGSRGSVIPYFLNLKKEKVSFPVTDERMTRFMITLNEGINLVLTAIGESIGGEIFIKKIPSMRIVDIAAAIDPKANINIIGVRPGEKVHEQMIGIEDAPYTYEYDSYYKILPAIHNWHMDKRRIGEGKKVKPMFSYTSQNNADWMSEEQLKEWIAANVE